MNPLKNIFASFFKKLVTKTQEYDIFKNLFIYVLVPVLIASIAGLYILWNCDIINEKYIEFLFTEYFTAYFVFLLIRLGVKFHFLMVEGINSQIQSDGSNYLNSTQLKVDVIWIIVNLLFVAYLILAFLHWLFVLEPSLIITSHNDYNRLFKLDK